MCGWVNSARHWGELGTLQASASGQSLTRNHQIRLSPNFSSPLARSSVGRAEPAPRVHKQTFTQAQLPRRHRVISLMPR